MQDLVAALSVARPHVNGFLHGVLVNWRVEALRSLCVAYLVNQNNVKRSATRKTLHTLHFVVHWRK